jgi:HlyD family secretion protein
MLSKAEFDAITDYLNALTNLDNTLGYPDTLGVACRTKLNGTAMERDRIVADRILDDMSDGVMTINLRGGSSPLTGLPQPSWGSPQKRRWDVPLASFFCWQKKMMSFNQTILDAIYESSTSHNRMVSRLPIMTVRLTLALTTTFLKADDGTDQHGGYCRVQRHHRTAGAAGSRSSDGRRAEKQAPELQAAYLKTEEGNQQLQSALKKVQIIRNTATAFTILLFLGIGLFVWNRKPATSSRSKVLHLLQPGAVSQRCRSPRNRSRPASA